MMLEIIFIETNLRNLTFWFWQWQSGITTKQSRPILESFNINAFDKKVTKISFLSAKDGLEILWNGRSDLLKHI